MGKSYLDYDKVTWKDVVLRYLKVCGLSLGGALVGCIPVVIYFCFANFDEYNLFFLAGLGSMLFYGVFMTKENRRWFDHFGIIIFSFLGTFVGHFVYYFIYYSDRVDKTISQGRFMNTINAYFIDPLPVGQWEEGLVEVSPWTTYIASLIPVILGIYITFLFVLASGESENKKTKNKKNKKH